MSKRKRCIAYFIVLIILISAVFVRHDLMGYALLISFIMLVGEGIVSEVRKNKVISMVNIIFGPQLVVIFIAITGPIIPVNYELIAVFFDEGLSSLMVSAGKTIESLASIGIYDRGDEIKSYMAIIFASNLFLARGYLLSQAYVGDSYKKSAVDKYYSDKGAERSVFMYVVFYVSLAVLAMIVFYFDMYNPDCIRRCTYVEHGNLPQMNKIAFCFSVLILIIGLYLGSIRIKKSWTEYKKEKLEEE